MDFDKSFKIAVLLLGAAILVGVLARNRAPEAVTSGMAAERFELETGMHFFVLILDKASGTVYGLEPPQELSTRVKTFVWNPLDGTYEKIVRTFKEIEGGPAKQPGAPAR